MTATEKIYIFMSEMDRNDGYSRSRLNDDQIEYTRSDLEPTWMPIETAPVNHEFVLLFWNGEMVTGYFTLGNWFTVQLGLHGLGVFNKPTHWMPLPKPPRVES